MPTRRLHVLPQLYVRLEDLDELTCSVIELSVSASCVGWELTPPGGIVIRQPYPNRRYFVAGSATTRAGWTVDVPDDVECFTLIFRWSTPASPPSTNGKWVVHHKIRTRLRPGADQDYTMDATCWNSTSDPTWRRDLRPLMFTQPTTLISPELTELGDRSIAWTFERNAAVLHQSDEIELPCIPITERGLAPLGADQEQLHEITQVARFERGNDQHRANACIEMPPSLLARAITLAMTERLQVQNVPGEFESHPAMRLLCEWWNSRAPDESTRCAAHAMAWTRVRDGDEEEYWCAFEETPNVSLAWFETTASAQARVGDAVIVEFRKSSLESTWDQQHGLTNYLVDGNVVNIVGISDEDYERGNYDEAWYGVDGLDSFPTLFPEAWTAMLLAAE